MSTKFLIFFLHVLQVSMCYCFLLDVSSFFGFFVFDESFSFWPFFLGVEVGFPPLGGVVQLCVPRVGEYKTGIGPWGCGRPLGLGLPSLGQGLALFESGLARARPKRGRRPAKKVKMGRPSKGPAEIKGREGPGLIQESRKCEARSDPKGQYGKDHLFINKLTSVDKYVSPTLGKEIGPSFSWVFWPFLFLGRGCEVGVGPSFSG